MTLNKRQLQERDERHENIEDLLTLGASLAEVIERSGYKGWAGVRTSLRSAGRTDLLERLKAKLPDSDLPPERRTRKPKPKCEANHLCANRPIDGLCLFHWRVRESRCTRDDCLDPIHGKGLCRIHYFRQYRIDQKEGTIAS